jgi:hypothetical protein
MMCARCGIDSDTLFCRDCLEVELGNVWMKGEGRAHRDHRAGHGPNIKAQRAELITEQHKLGRTDPEIAALFGIDVRTVLRWRKKLGLESNFRQTPPSESTMRAAQEGYRNYRRRMSSQ